MSELYELDSKSKVYLCSSKVIKSAANELDEDVLRSLPDSRVLPRKVEECGLEYIFRLSGLFHAQTCTSPGP